ncbi:ATP-binding protein [Actinoplanes sp. NPDC026623]|uniref:AAA family ATPase n=1 Tax=Actinoplanes sp. NPDC026623 TaxID=3155610 RepID=UPI0033DE2611
MTDQLFAALRRLDTLLAVGVARAEVAYGPAASGDAFRGLHIDRSEVEQLLARAPGEPFLASIGEPDDPPGAGLAALAARFDLTPFDADVVAIAVAPEVDLRYERLYAYLQDDVNRRRPTVDLVLNMLCRSAADRVAQVARFQADAPLLRNGILRWPANGAQHEAPLIARSLRLDEQIVRFLIGGRGLDSRLAPFCAFAEPSAGAGHPPVTEALRDVVEPLADAASAGRPMRVYLQGPPGLGRRRVAEQVAARAGRPLLVADLDRVPPGQPLADLLPVLFRQASLDGAICFLHGVDALLAGRSDGGLRSLAQQMVAGGLVVVLAGSEPWPALSLTGTAAPLALRVVPCPMPTFVESRQVWQSELDRSGIEVGDPGLDVLAGRIRLTPEQVAEAAATARPLHPAVAAAGLDEVLAAARRQAGQGLGGLAVKLDPIFVWADLVLAEDSVRQLGELCRRVIHRQQVLEEWGFGSRFSLGRGVSALFAGPPGTGKTMAAEIVARELGLDLYRIDLSGIVSKWIGETEKNLDRIFRAAGDANAILLFDEADALFGKRSEVRDSHDRFANVEVSYLLQKMEMYEGVAILSTNRSQDLDEAFLRRLGFVVRFPPPDETERLRIWTTVWPRGVPMAPEVDLDGLARELPFTGAEIKNVALAAAFLAAENGGAVTMAEILHATRREYEKAGKVFDGFGPTGPGGLDDGS